MITTKKFVLSALSIIAASTASAEPVQLPGLSKAQLSQFPSRQNSSSNSNDGQLADSGVPIGRGYNGLTGEFRGDCVRGNVKTSGVDAKSVNFSLNLAQSSEEFRQVANMSASASFGMGAWGSEVSSEYYRSSSRSHFTDHLVIKVVVEGITKTIDTPKLTNNAAYYVARGEDFYHACGNRFVRSITLGGEFSAVVDIETNSVEERSQLQAKLSAISRVYGSANAEFSNAIQQISKSNLKNILIIRNGTGEVLPSLEIDDLIKYALAFPAKINGTTGTPVKMETIDYQVINPSLKTYASQEVVANNFATRYGELFEWLSDLNYYARHRSDLAFYPPLSEDQLTKGKSDLTKASDAARTAYIECYENPTKKCDEQLFPSVTVSVPRPASSKPLNPKQASPQFVGTAGPNEKKTIVILGQWQPWANGPWFPPEHCCFSVLIEGGAEPSQTLDYNGPINITGPARVSIKVSDSSMPGAYDDNSGQDLAAVVY